MKQITRTALVAFSAEQMFDLVNDVASYPKFLPGCTGTRILESSMDSMIAAVDVSKVGISKTFTTSNILVRGQSIEMNLIDGPFKVLQGGWIFKAFDEQACQIELNLEFEFKSKMIEVAFGKIFHELVINMVHAFTMRAKQVY